MTETDNAGGFSRLQRLARQSVAKAEAAQERCDFCSQPIPAEHRHLLEVESREVRCVCQACSLLFDRDVASLGKYRLVSHRRRVLDGFRLDDAQWDRLRIPVGIVFLVRSAGTNAGIAFYPSPFGATEALLETAVWKELEAANPELREIQPEVEALLINRARGAREYFLVPIDDCYRLVALVRMHWRGLGGGQEVWQELKGFFETLREKAK